jgi:hypothetical protein
VGSRAEAAQDSTATDAFASMRDREAMSEPVWDSSSEGANLQQRTRGNGHRGTGKDTSMVRKSNV